MLAQTHFLSQWTDEWQAFWSHFGALGAPRGFFKKLGGVKGSQRGAIRSPKGVLEGSF